MYVQLIHLPLYQNNKMSESCHTYQEYCLYFTANSLSRCINEMAEEELTITGLAPSYVYLMLILIQEPGLSQGELSERMNLKASTMTRFIDKLVQKNLAERVQEGRSAYIYPTEDGKNMQKLINKGLKNLFEKYCKVLGKDFAVKLTENIHKANIALRE